MLLSHLYGSYSKQGAELLCGLQRSWSGRDERTILRRTCVKYLVAFHRQTVDSYIKYG